MRSGRPEEVKQPSEENEPLNKLVTGLSLVKDGFQSVIRRNRWRSQAGRRLSSRCATGILVLATAANTLIDSYPRGRFRGLKPSTPGNSAPRSLASRPMIFASQPSAVCRARMSRPINQYSRIRSRLTARAARNCATARCEHPP